MCLSTLSDAETKIITLSDWMMEENLKCVPIHYLIYVSQKKNTSLLKNEISPTAILLSNLNLFPNMLSGHCNL